MQARERTTNTRKSGETRQRPAPVKVERPTAPVAFSGYCNVPDADGYFFWHQAPLDYSCTQLTVHFDAFDGGAIEIGVNNTEFVRVDVEPGTNVIEMNRVLPAGARVRARLLDGVTARGIWLSWVGVASA
jgi:hypothetical protein